MQRKGYEPGKPRTAIGFIAIAASAITIGSLVVLPAELAATGGEPFELAEAKAAAGALLEFASAGRIHSGEAAPVNGKGRTNAQPNDPQCEEPGKATD
ncbi:MAG TPA: hypothetical protein VEN29_20225 [Casimicrobiaceae bacterium]|nr:hypothetical protein [Casimicrobiaceae bacterium]